MEKKKIIKRTLLGILGVLILGVAGYFGYRYYIKLKAEVRPVYHAVPGNSNALIEINKPAEFWKRFKDNQLHQELNKIPEFEKWFSTINFVDSLTNTNEFISKWTRQEKLLFSLHYRGSGRFSVLGMLQLPNTRQRDRIINYMEKHVAISQLTTEPYKIYRAAINDSTDFFFTVPEGIWIASFDKELLHQSIDFLTSEQHILKLENFKKVYESRGKNVDANFYFNHKGFHRFIAKFAADNRTPDLSNWSDYGGWTELDLLMENEGLWFSGYTKVNDSSNQFLNTFIECPPGKIKMPEILPASTALLSYYGFKDFDSFYNDYKTHQGKKKKRKNYIKNFKNEYGIDLSKHLLAWIDDEMAKSVIKASHDTYYQYAVINSRDAKETVQSLNSLALGISENIDKPLDTSEYRGFTIGKLRDPYIFPMTFGQRFNFLVNPSYTVINSYAVFANSDTALKYMINEYMLNETLKNNAHYKNFSQKIAEQANVYLYYNLRYALDYLMPAFTTDVKEFINENKKHLSDIPYGGYQYKYQNGKIYTNFYIKADTSSVHESNAEWQTVLDAPLAKAPEFVIDHYKERKKIIAFDIRKQMYMIDRKGNIEWKIKLKELPLGSVELIDYYDNGKYQYLFNTPSYVYCIALNGKTVKNFPFKAENEMTNPLAAFDYKGDKDYRIVAAGSDMKIYNYQKDGEQTSGWEKPSMEYLVKNKIQRIVLDNKDFIIVADTSGSVKYLSRRGVNRISPEPAFTNDPGTKFYKVNREGKEMMMTTDKAGRIILIDKEGKVNKYTLNEFSVQYSFGFSDINNDGNREYIFLDNSSIYIYNREFEIIRKQQFDNKVHPRLNLYSGDGKPRIFLRTKQNNRIIRLEKHSLKPFKKIQFSRHPVMIYQNPPEKAQNMIITKDNIIESVAIE